MAPSIKYLLSDRTLFGDAEPNWTVGKSHAPNPTADDAEGDRQKFLRLCRRWRDDYLPLRAIGLKIAACRDDFPCTSGACPRCQRAMQRFFVREVARHLNTTDYLYCTVVPTKLDPNTKLGKDTSNFAVARRRLKRHLREAEIEFALGFWDFSFNSWGAGRYRLFPHFHGFMVEAEFRAAERAFRALHPQTLWTNRPVLAVPFDGNLSAAGYAAKSKFELRKGYVTARGDGGNAPAAMMRQTRKGDPLAAQRAELAILLDRIGLLDRLVRKGMKIAVQRDGVRLVRSTPPPLAT